MDELGKSFPAAEGMVDAEQSGNPKGRNENCLNCGTKLIDNFCHHCGQKDIPRRQTLGELFTNFISSFWSYEGKFFLTTRYLITKPGFLAMEYNAGRRESYYHPARMYVFISFVFFLLFVSLPDGNNTKKEPLTENASKGLQESGDKIKKVNVDSILGNIPMGEMSEEDRKELQQLRDGLRKTKFDSLLGSASGQDSTTGNTQKLDSVGKKSTKKNKWNFGLQKAEYKSVKTYDSVQGTKPEKDRDGWLKKKLTIRAIELNKKYEGEGSNFSEDFGTAFKDNFSKVLFYLLPVFALLFKLLYVRRNFYYSEHLVFSIYYYNFFYLAGSIQMLMRLVPFLSWLPTLIGFWIFFYLLFAMKRMYEQSWKKTILKFFLFVFAFFWCVALALAVSAMAILMMI